MRQTEVRSVVKTEALPAIESPISDAEAKQMREEKLATIRQAVAAGAYDSDDLLEKALGRMIRRIEESADAESDSASA